MPALAIVRLLAGTPLTVALTVALGARSGVLRIVRQPDPNGRAARNFTFTPLPSKPKPP